MPVLVSCVFVQEARRGPVLRIVHRVIAGWLADQTGVERTTAQCCAVTLIQRFGSALNLNVHFHMLWLDGVCEPGAARPARSRIACAGIWRAKADSKAKTNRHFCPTAQAAKTAWTRCECARAPEARTPVPIHRAPPDPVSWRLCAERSLARAAHTVRARQTSCYGRRIDSGQQRPPQPRRKAPPGDL